MQEKTLFLLSITFIFALLITINIPTERTLAQITRIKYYNNLCVLTTSDEQDILVFTSQILNIKPGDNLGLEIKKSDQDLIAEKIIKIK